jgi:N-acetylmuramoyl-L-alanine amidase CwlA
MNSFYVDNKFSVNQTIRLPKFYNAQKTLLLEEWKNSVLNLDLQKWQLKKEISLVYNELNYLDEKKKLLKKADSIFTQYYNRAELAIEKRRKQSSGKSNRRKSEKSGRNATEIFRKRQRNCVQKLNFLINDGTFYQNEKGKYGILNFENLNAEYAGNPLVLKQLEQEKNIQNAKLLPKKPNLSQVLFAYNNTSMYGNGADDKFYNVLQDFILE